MRAVALAGLVVVGLSGAIGVKASAASSDLTPPQVRILAPTAEAVLSGLISGASCSAAASDDHRVTAVDFLLDGRMLTRETRRPYNCDFDTRRYVAGRHLLTAVAHDAAGNVRTSVPVAVWFRDGIAATPTPAPMPVSPAVPPSVPAAPGAPAPDPGPTPVPRPEPVTSPVGATTAAPAETTLWRATMDAGDLGEWWSPTADGVAGDNGGGEFNSGQADSVASPSFARSGAWSARMTWTGPMESGTRLFRWRELATTRRLYAEAWFYLPTAPTLTGDPARNRTVNIMQFKSMSQDGTRNDPFWYLVMKERSGVVRPVLTWGAQSGVAGPAAQDTVGFRDYYNPALEFPVRRWFRIRAYIEQSSAFDGAVSFWLDDELIAGLTGVRTGFPNTKLNPWHVVQHWSVNNYSDGLAPAPFSLYVDDARIYTRD